ncbi:MAG: ribosome modulation factor [Pseudomonadota bacterium]|nr:ribosome modulation factor [Pseudomonadota bacterium]
MAKTLKRDLPARAYSRGYRAGLGGKSKELCPHQNATSRHQWLSGWRQGREDNWSGMQGVSAIHRLPLG